ncbi:MAG: SUMF1/EgtB/PvdO family nonheme iron enzyme, partial [Muribaculaceae bacterium]|nr:SUMF1/EgtB/PvdO family nonheme iron enzyme [Muribaculaceae bacterium]
YTGNSDAHTHVVATKAPNELGIYDMSGNVWEPCQDWWSTYTSASLGTAPTRCRSCRRCPARSGLSWPRHGCVHRCCLCTKLHRRKCCCRTNGSPGSCCHHERHTPTRLRWAGGSSHPSSGSIWR